MPYTLVAPKDFTPEQKTYIEQLKKSVCLFSEHTNAITAIKNTALEYMIANDSTAKAVGLPRWTDLIDRSDHDIPAEGVAQFADVFEQQERTLLASHQVNRQDSILDVLHFGDGLKARLFNKRMLIHSPSSSVLGVILEAHEIPLGAILHVLPNYYAEFGTSFTIEKADHAYINHDVQLTEYEHEICFLSLLNWSAQQIANFMNKHRPTRSLRNADAIYKCRNRVCAKLGLPSDRLADLKEMLVAVGVHRKMPALFFNKITGSTVLRP